MILRVPPTSWTKLKAYICLLMPGLHLLASCRRIFRASGSAGMRLYQTHTSRHRARSLWRSPGSLCLAWTPAWSTLLEQNTSWACRPNLAKPCKLPRCNASMSRMETHGEDCDQVRTPARSPPFAGLHCVHSMLRLLSDFASFVRASLQDLSWP